MDIYILSFVGIVLGSIFLTIYNYLWKILGDSNLRFDQKYLITMLVSILLSIMATPLIFLNVTIPLGSDFYVFISMAAIGFTVNHVINKPVAHFLKAMYFLQAMQAQNKDFLKALEAKKNEHT